MNFIVLDIILLFVDQFEKNLNKEEHPLTSRIFSIIKQLLNSQSEYFISCMYAILAGLIFKLKKPLFAHKTTSYCQDLIYRVVQHCNSTNADVRNKASTLFYFLMKVISLNY